MAGWEEMREAALGLLLRSTGRDLAAWTADIDAALASDPALAAEPGLRAWLDARGVHGYAQMVVVMERLGYPDHFLRSGEELVAAQYADRPALRPVLDAVLAASAGLDPLTLQARKGYLSLVAGRQLAVVRPTTRTRVDLGLRLDEPVGGRLLAAPGLANETIGVRVALHGPGDVDDEVRDLLRRAHAANT